MEKVFIALGSNLGEKHTYLEKACVLLKSLALSNWKQSSIYQTAPEGFLNQPDFLNQVVSFDTALPPRYLLQTLKNFELRLGRQKRERWHEREIDLDLLAYGNQIISEADFQVPHPRIAERLFVICPLQEIEPDWVHPLTGDLISELKEMCQLFKPQHSEGLWSPKGAKDEIST